MTALIMSATFLYAGAMARGPARECCAVVHRIRLHAAQRGPFWVATMAVSGRHAPIATGVLNTGGNLPGVLGGVLVPFVAGGFGWSLAMATGSVFAIVGAFLWLFIRADEPMSV